MFRSAPSINSRKAKETQHETISPPCAGRSRPPEFGWYLIKRVRRGSSVEMPAPICLRIPVYNSPSGFRGRRMQQVLQGDKRVGHSAGPFFKPDSTNRLGRHGLMGTDPNAACASSSQPHPSRCCDDHVSPPSMPPSLGGDRGCRTASSCILARRGTRANIGIRRRQYVVDPGGDPR
jgi:hypothetical protein